MRHQNLADLEAFAIVAEEASTHALRPRKALPFRKADIFI